MKKLIIINILFLFFGCTIYCQDLIEEDYEALSFVKNPDKLWEDGIVFYKVDPTFSVEQKNKIRETMDYIISTLEPGCIQFARATVSTNYFVDFKKDLESCSTFPIGRKLKGDRITTVKLMDQCFVAPGTVLHEIVHTIGAAHEHIRPDRNLFIDINCDDIVNGKDGVQYQQFTRKFAYSKTEYTPYDLRSVMHYRQLEIDLASKDTKKPVLKVRDAFKNIQDLSKKTELKLSPTDIVEISRNYNCSLKPGLENDYISYVNEITTALVDHMQSCLDGREKSVEGCLEGVEIAELYLDEWMRWDDRSSDYNSARGKLDNIIRDHQNTIDSNEDRITKMFQQPKDIPKRKSVCP